MRSLSVARGIAVFRSCLRVFRVTSPPYCVDARSGNRETRGCVPLPATERSAPQVSRPLRQFAERLSSEI